MSSAAVRGLVVLAAAAIFALSWQHELYLIVVALPAAAITLAVHDRLADRADARRLAALALVAPSGVVDGSAVERIVEADLAAASLGDRRILERAINLAENSIDDAWERALVCERLEAAKLTLAGSAFDQGAPWALLRSRAARAAVAVSVVAVLAAIVVTGHKALLAPLALAIAAFSLTYGELRRSEQLRALLVHQATAEPARGRVVVPDAAVVTAIERLAEGRPRVRRTANLLVEAWPGPEQSIARRRLQTIPANHARLSRVDRDVALFTATATALVALIETVGS